MKYRLFDFSSGDGELLTRGGLERVSDHAEAIGQVLGELRAADWIASEDDLAAVGLQLAREPVREREPRRERRRRTRVTALEL